MRSKRYHRGADCFVECYVSAIALLFSLCPLPVGTMHLTIGLFRRVFYLPLCDACGCPLRTGTPRYAPCHGPRLLPCHPGDASRYGRSEPPARPSRNYPSTQEMAGG